MRYIFLLLPNGSVRKVGTVPEPVQVLVSLGFTDVDTSNFLRFDTSNVSEKVVATASPSQKIYHHTKRVGKLFHFAFYCGKNEAPK